MSKTPITPVNKRFSLGPIAFAAIMFPLLLTACGGGGGGGGGEGDGAGSDSSTGGSTEFTLHLEQTKRFRFSWTDVDSASFYRLMENPDGVSGFTQVGADIPAGTEMYIHEVPLYARVNARYILQSCTDAGCTDSSELSVSGNLAEAVGYIKASNTDSGDGFGGYGVFQSDYGGTALALSADGTTLVVGAPYEDSAARVISGTEDDNSSDASGAVYVFTRTVTGWAQQAYIKASNADSFDLFGSAVALSADGSTLAVGAFAEASKNSDQSNNSAAWSGAVYVFTRSGTTWNQQAYVKASNPKANDQLGSAVALSGDGNTLAVGAPSGDTTAVLNSGAVYVFSRSGTDWSQQDLIEASKPDDNDNFGSALALSADGNTLAVGAPYEDSAARVIGGSQDDNSAEHSGAVYVFTRSSSTWNQQAYVKASNTDSGDLFGFSVTLSSDGNTLAVGAKKEESNATGINDSAGQSDNSLSYAGAVYVFTRSVTDDWSQQAYVKASNTNYHQWFGNAVTLSGDGNTLAVGAIGEGSKAMGINDDQSDISQPRAGAVYVFRRSDSTWSQLAYVKAPNTEIYDRFGSAVALSSDANTLAVGASEENSAATGINGDQADNSAENAGAVYLY